MIMVMAIMAIHWKFIATMAQSGSACPVNYALGESIDPEDVLVCLSWLRAL